MIYILLGIAGFVFCCVFDLNKTYWNYRFLNLSFTLGSILLVFSTFMCILQADLPTLLTKFGIYHLLILICLTFSIMAEIYALFFALPFQTTYMENTTASIVTKGWYAACRHPGFWTLAFVYLFLWLLFGDTLLFYAFVIYTLCNLLYILIQDTYIFPKYIQGYDEYKKTVPFLVPTKVSLYSAFIKK